MGRRVFLIVLDSVGIGEMPDAAAFGDVGSNTLASVRSHPAFSCPTLTSMGLFAIDGVSPVTGAAAPVGSFARMRERSKGKDTTVGHWEIAGVVSPRALPTYPDGFPREIISSFEAATGRRVICNLPYSGTDVIRDYGRESVETGALIVYTSADSVFQIAAHEAVVPVEELYRDCEIARKLLCGEHAVGRVIARPFEGEHPFVRTPRRHDFSLTPPAMTMLDLLLEGGRDTVGIGKIGDIFALRGVSESNPTGSNAEGMRLTEEMLEREFDGLCFVNLVDFDMKWGHRNDVEGYAKGLSAFDAWLSGFLPRLRPSDVCIITADHGCDPATPSTDHSREYTPMLITGGDVKKGVNLGTRESFADIGATVLEILGIDPSPIAGKSFWGDVREVNDEA